MRWRRDWERSVAGDKKPYWYADCLDVNSRPLWMARIEPFGRNRYVLMLRIAGYNFSNNSYYDSVEEDRRLHRVLVSGCLGG